MYMNAKNYARVFVPMFGDPFFHNEASKLKGGRKVVFVPMFGDPFFTSKIA